MDVSTPWGVHTAYIHYLDAMSYAITPTRHCGIPALGTILSRARMTNGKETSHNRGMS